MKSSKGSDYERSTCRQLSLWWSEGKRDDLFWRSSNSGGRAKMRKRKGQDTFGQYGDVAATDPAGGELLQVFTIELKRGYNANTLFQMLDKPKNAAEQKWEEFFRQAHGDHVNAGSLAWMLIWRRDRRESIVHIPLNMMTKLEAIGAELNRLPSIKARLSLKSALPAGWWTQTVFACKLDDFLTAVQPDHVRGLL